MANLTITTACNLRCPFCFAASHMHASPPQFISLHTFAAHLDFLDRSGIDQVRLIGGEPTLHPQFPELIRQIQQRQRRLLLFSHGLIPESALHALIGLPPDQCRVLINTNASSHADGRPTATEIAHRHTVMSYLGPRALPGMTLYSINLDLLPLLTLIQETGCLPVIRLGLAHPTLDGRNRYLSPKQYRLMGRRVSQFATQAARLGVTLEFDCGFIPCMFSPDDLKLLHQAHADIGWHCNPILDISLQGQAIHCFPLTGRIQIPLQPDSQATTLRQQLITQTAPYRTIGLYPECPTCSHRHSGTCPGGCLSHVMRRFHHNAIHLEIPDIPANAR